MYTVIFEGFGLPGTFEWNRRTKTLGNRVNM